MQMATIGTQKQALLVGTLLIFLTLKTMYHSCQLRRGSVSRRARREDRKLIAWTGVEIRLLQGPLVMNPSPGRHTCKDLSLLMRGFQLVMEMAYISPLHTNGHPTLHTLRPYRLNYRLQVRPPHHLTGHCVANHSGSVLPPRTLVTLIEIRLDRTTIGEGLRVRKGQLSCRRWIFLVPQTAGMRAR